MELIGQKQADLALQEIICRIWQETSSAALAFGGRSPGTFAGLTEEWTGAGAPIGAWSTASGNLNTARRGN